MRYTRDLLLPNPVDKIQVRYPLAYHADGKVASYSSYENANVVAHHKVREGHIYVVRVMAMLVPPPEPPR